MAHASTYDDSIKYITDTFKTGGITAVKSYVDKTNNEWKNVDINIAIIGNSGTGKSSFINAIRGLTADDEGSAAVGVTETTKDITSYPHPSNSKLVLWDLPGLGTPIFNRKNYFVQVKVDMFDNFVFMTSDRFRDDDLWLAAELKAKDKPIYFVRSKVGQDMANNKKSHPNTHTDTGVLDRIRKDCERNLQSSALDKGLTVYLIDSFEPKNYDFGLFSEKLIEDAPEMKKRAMILSMTLLTETIILAKKETLSRRICWLSVISALVGAVPVPLIDSTIDIQMYTEEAVFYKNQFGLSDKQLDAYLKGSNESKEQFASSLDLKSPHIKLTRNSLLMYLATAGLKTASLATSETCLLPTLETVGSGCISYGLMYLSLNNLLDITAEDAIKINKHRASVDTVL